MIKLIIFLILSISSSYADIQEHLDYLASDELAGRKAGEKGNILAANYLKSFLKENKISPLGRDYEQKFTIFSEMRKIDENSLKSKEVSNILFEPLAISANGSLQNTQMAFVGFGITIPANETKLKYDDYKNIDVKNKIVICMTGDPGIGNPNSKFRDPDYSYYQSKTYKINNAFQHGASAILFIENPLSIQAPEKPPVFIGQDGAGNSVRIMAGNIQNNFINQVLFTKMNLLKIQNKIMQTQRPYSFLLESRVDLKINLLKQTKQVANIHGFIKGTDENLNKEIIVLGAHFDHLGRGGSSSLDPEYGHIHHGADDNASGTAFLMELARYLKQNEKSLKRSYLISFYNAEEMGLLGSKYFMQSWPRYQSTFGDIKAMINFDMIGRLNEKISLMGMNSSLSWLESLNKLKTNSFKFKKNTIMASDHASFLNEKVPSLFFTTGAHQDYHRSSDTSDKINYKGLEKLRVFVEGFLVKMDDLEKITFNKDFEVGESNRSRGYGAHLGCIPEFAQDQSIIGVQCSGVSKKSPAQRAGLIASDILKKIGEVEIKNIYDLSFALKYYRAGDEVEVIWKRKDKYFQKKIRLAKRSSR